MATKDFHFEQTAATPANDQTTYSTIAKKPLEERSDRELELSKIYLQRKTNQHLSSIAKNMQFFFWITIISMILVVLAYAMNEM